MNSAFTQGIHTGLGTDGLKEVRKGKKRERREEVRPAKKKIEINNFSEIVFQTQEERRRRSSQAMIPAV